MQYNWISVVSSTRFMLSVTSHPQRWGTVRTFGQCLICSGLCIHDHCMILTWKSSILTHTKVKGHPTTGWGGPRGSGYVKAPNFLDVQHYEGCRSSAICTSCLYPRRNPWYSFSGAVSTPGHMVPSRGATEKIPSDTTGNRSRDRLVAQCLIHYATPGPWPTQTGLNSCTGYYVSACQTHSCEMISCDLTTKSVPSIAAVWCNVHITANNLFSSVL